MSDLITRLLMNEDDFERQNIAKELAELGTEGIQMLLNAMKSDRNTKVFLLTLSRMVGKEKLKDYLMKEFKKVNFKPLLSYAEDADAKIRKSAYVIMGAMQGNIIRESLLSSLDSEDTLFLIPSIILALGNIGDYSVIDIIRKKQIYYRELLGKEPTETKHINEILRAIDKSLDKLDINIVRHKFNELDRTMPIMLTTMEGQSEVTLTEAKRYFPSARIIDNYVLIDTNNLLSVYRLRTFYEALLSPGGLISIKFEATNIAKKLLGNFTIEMLNLWHNGDAPYRYRIELVSDMQGRSNAIEDIVRAIDKTFEGRLINSTSNYELEFRIEEADNKCSIFIKLYTISDNRYNYRINSVPASIKGTTAAICMKLAAPYLRDNVRVLDPFMGTGTMLIERNLLSSNLSLYGVDIYSKAISFAKENIVEAGVRANFYNCNILNHIPEEPYDEIISNMPYGLRVGTHKENEELYYEFMKNIPSLLKKDGYLILLTADYHLLKDAAFVNDMKLVKEFVIPCGGLTPHLFVFRRP